MLHSQNSCERRAPCTVPAVSFSFASKANRDHFFSLKFCYTHAKNGRACASESVSAQAVAVAADIIVEVVQGNTDFIDLILELCAAWPLSIRVYEYGIQIFILCIYCGASAFAAICRNSIFSGAACQVSDVSEVYVSHTPEAIISYTTTPLRTISLNGGRRNFLFLLWGHGQIIHLRLLCGYSLHSARYSSCAALCVVWAGHYYRCRNS